MRVLVIADDTDRDGGYVIDRLLERGATVHEVDRDALSTAPQVEMVESSPTLAVVLGSHRSAHDPAHARCVDAEMTLLRGLLDAGCAVLGVCYGAQILARALGGHSYRADRPEVGWSRVDTDDPTLCPEGPWAQFHQDVFVPAPTTRVLGSTWAGPQAFIDGSRSARAIAWQFHPEVRPEVFARWAQESAHIVRAAGLSRDELARQTRQWGSSSRRRATLLVDAALEYLDVDARPAPRV